VISDLFITSESLSSYARWNWIAAPFASCGVSPVYPSTFIQQFGIGVAPASCQHSSLKLHYFTHQVPVHCFDNYQSIYSANTPYPHTRTRYDVPWPYPHYSWSTELQSRCQKLPYQHLLAATNLEVDRLRSAVHRVLRCSLRQRGRHWRLESLIARASTTIPSYLDLEGGLVGLKLGWGELAWFKELPGGESEVLCVCDFTSI